MLRAPNGVVKTHELLSAGAQYDPGKITVPTFLLHAEWDADYRVIWRGGITQLRARPTNAWSVSEGTHTVMMERTACSFP